MGRKSASPAEGAEEATVPNPARDRAREQPLEGLLDRVRAITPLVASRAREAERERKPDDEVIEALEASGVFRSFVPSRFGGYEIGLDLFVDIGVAVSAACPSTGWITTFYMEHNWLLTLFSDELQEEVFGAAPFVLAPGSVNPKGGEATPKGDGYELTGHWHFGTGIVHADWVLLNAHIATEPPGGPRLFLVHPEDVEVRDNWHVDGMVATGSRDILAKSLHVPERCVSLAVPPMVSAGEDATYLMRLPVLPFLSLTAAIPALGAARRAVELYRELAGGRVKFGTHKVQGQGAATQIRLANALAEVRAAETVLRAAARAMEAHARRQAELSPLEQIELRLTIAHVVRDCRRVVRHVMEGSGASVHYLDHELQRINRDVQMMGAHTAFDVDLVAEQCGRARLGSDEPLFPRS
jgi:3-hydroxy-9,10-secoandrosta-1,3,5(10)-triene-9,17-dione monooxygenase